MYIILPGLRTELRINIVQNRCHVLNCKLASYLRLDNRVFLNDRMCMYIVMIVCIPYQQQHIGNKRESEKEIVYLRQTTNIYLLSTKSTRLDRAEYIANKNAIWFTFENTTSHYGLRSTLCCFKQVRERKPISTEIGTSTSNFNSSFAMVRNMNAKKMT